MSSITTSTKSVEQLLSERDATIASAVGEIEKLEAAKTASDQKARLSAGGRLANRVREIAELELDLALAGAEFTPWQKPVTSRSRQETLSQEDIESSIAALMEVYKRAGTPDSVKASADQRIKALVKAGEKRGYKIANPIKK